MFLVPLISIFLILGASDMNARLIDGHLVIVEKNTSPKTGKIYSILKITQREGAKRMYRIPRESDGHPSQETMAFFLRKNYVPYITDGITFKVWTEYEKRGRLEALNALAQERPFFNGVSTFVVICDENDLSKIHALGRLVRKGSGLDRLLDIESRLNFELPKVPLIHYTGYPHPFGNWGELKTLIQSKDREEEFIPLLWAALGRHASHSLTFSPHFWRWSLDTPQDPPETIKYPNNSDLSQPLMDHYVLETDEAGERIYRKWGFETYRRIGNIFVMTQTLEGIESLMREMDRKGEYTAHIQPEEEWVAWPQLPASFYLAFDQVREFAEGVDALAKAQGESPYINLNIDGIPIDCLNILARTGQRPFIFRRNADKNIKTWSGNTPRSPW